MFERFTISPFRGRKTQAACRARGCRGQPGGDPGLLEPREQPGRPARALAGCLGGAGSRTSDETAPRFQDLRDGAGRGRGYQPDYLNCVAEIECGVPAIELLRYCQGLESALGRVRKAKAPRTIDVDVLLFGEEVRRTGPRSPAPRITPLQPRGPRGSGQRSAYPGPWPGRSLLASADRAA